MSHTPHELTDEFPAEVERIHELKEANAHFAKLVDEYQELNRAVYLAETKVQPTDDFHEGELRKKRAALKDEIWAILKAA